MQLDPAGSGGHGLSAILRAPSLHEAHADGAHARELVHGLEALVDALREERGELLVVEDLQVAAGRDLADLKQRNKAGYFQRSKIIFSGFLLR